MLTVCQLTLHQLSTDTSPTPHRHFTDSSLTVGWDPTLCNNAISWQLAARWLAYQQLMADTDRSGISYGADCWQWPHLWHLHVDVFLLMTDWAIIRFQNWFPGNGHNPWHKEGGGRHAKKYHISLCMSHCGWQRSTIYGKGLCRRYANMSNCRLSNLQRALNRDKIFWVR